MEGSSLGEVAGGHGVQNFQLLSWTGHPSEEHTGSYKFRLHVTLYSPYP